MLFAPLPLFVAFQLEHPMIILSRSITPMLLSALYTKLPEAIMIAHLLTAPLVFCLRA